MKTTSIAEAKNHLSDLIRQLDAGEPVHLTRYGKPVAVMMSERQYQSLFQSRNLYDAIKQWRLHIDSSQETGFDEQELENIRKNSQGREFSWEE